MHQGRIYITHCAAKKDDFSRGTGRRVTPDLLYTAAPTQRHLRDVGNERRIEAEITRLLREDFSFRFVVLEGQAGRMGSEGLEARLIATVARCGACRPSPDWLGRYSPVEKIRQSGLWLVQHLGAEPLSETDKARLTAAIAATRDWVQGQDRASGANVG
ncbi:MAG: hypothetical protein ACRDHF_10750 [Tepidiformaceae bacterium]